MLCCAVQPTLMFTCCTTVKVRGRRVHHVRPVWGKELLSVSHKHRATGRMALGPDSTRLPPSDALQVLVHVLLEITDEESLMAYTAARHQGVIEMFGPHSYIVHLCIESVVLSDSPAGWRSARLDRKCVLPQRWSVPMSLFGRRMCHWWASP